MLNRIKKQRIWSISKGKIPLHLVNKDAYDYKEFKWNYGEVAPELMRLDNSHYATLSLQQKPLTKNKLFLSVLDIENCYSDYLNGGAPELKLLVDSLCTYVEKTPNDGLHVLILTKGIISDTNIKQFLLCGYKADYLVNSACNFYNTPLNQLPLSVISTTDINDILNQYVHNHVINDYVNDFINFITYETLPAFIPLADNLNTNIYELDLNIDLNDFKNIGSLDYGREQVEIWLSELPTYEVEPELYDSYPAWFGVASYIYYWLGESGFDLFQAFSSSSPKYGASCPETHLKIYNSCNKDKVSYKAIKHLIGSASRYTRFKETKESIFIKQYKEILSHAIGINNYSLIPAYLQMLEDTQYFTLDEVRSLQRKHTWKILIEDHGYELPVSRKTLLPSKFILDFAKYTLLTSTERNIHVALSHGLALLHFISPKQLKLLGDTSNFYCLCYGETASGKTQSSKFLLEVLNKLGMQDYVISNAEIKSDEAFKDKINIREGRLFLSMDEFYGFLSQAKDGRHVDGAKQQICNTLKLAFDKSSLDRNLSLASNERAMKQGLADTITLPHIAMVSYLVTEQFEEIIKSSHATDGFLNRCTLINMGSSELRFNDNLIVDRDALAKQFILENMVGYVDYDEETETFDFPSPLYKRFYEGEEAVQIDISKEARRIGEKATQYRIDKQLPFSFGEERNPLTDAHLFFKRHGDMVRRMSAQITHNNYMKDEEKLIVNEDTIKACFDYFEKPYQEIHKLVSSYKSGGIDTETLDEITRLYQRLIQTENQKIKGDVARLKKLNLMHHRFLKDNSRKFKKMHNSDFEDLMESLNMTHMITVFVSEKKTNQSRGLCLIMLFLCIHIFK